jgi:hypothetical protein
MEDTMDTLEDQDELEEEAQEEVDKVSVAAWLFMVLVACRQKQHPVMFLLGKLMCSLCLPQVVEFCALMSYWYLGNSILSQYQLSWLRFVMGFLSPSKRMLELYLKIGWNHFHILIFTVFQPLNIV